MLFEWRYNQETGKPEVWYETARFIDWPPRTKDGPRRVRWDVNADEDTDYWAFGYTPSLNSAWAIASRVVLWIEERR